MQRWSGVGRVRGELEGKWEEVNGVLLWKLIMGQTRLFFFLSIYFTNVWCLHQKRISNPITDGYEPPGDCWELNPEHLEKQSAL